jgi:hypothetical protein
MGAVWERGDAFLPWPIACFSGFFQMPGRKRFSCGREIGKDVYGYA